MRGLLRAAVRNRARKRGENAILFSNTHVALVVDGAGTCTGVYNDTLCTAQVASISANEFGDYARPVASASNTRIMQAHAAYFAASGRTCRPQFMVRTAPRVGLLVSAGVDINSDEQFGQLMRGARSSVHFHPDVLAHLDTGMRWTANAPSYLRICGLYRRIMQYVLVTGSPVGFAAGDACSHDSMLNGLGRDDVDAISNALQCYVRELPTSSVTAISPRGPR